MSAGKLRDAARDRRGDLLAIVVGSLGFAVAIAWVVSDPEGATASGPIPYQVGFAARLVAAIGLITGISRLHRVHAPWAGGFGTASYATTIASLVLFAIVFSAFWVIGWLLFHLAALLFGIAVLRGRVLDRAAGWLLIVATTIGFPAGILVDRVVFDAQGDWTTFAGTALALVGFVWLAASEVRRSSANARRLARR